MLCFNVVSITFYTSFPVLEKLYYPKKKTSLGVCRATMCCLDHFIILLSWGIEPVYKFVVSFIHLREGQT